MMLLKYNCRVGELMRRSIEPILYQYGVDFVVVGYAMSTCYYLTH